MERRSLFCKYITFFLNFLNLWYDFIFSSKLLLTVFSHSQWLQGQFECYECTEYDRTVYLMILKLVDIFCNGIFVVVGELFFIQIQSRISLSNVLTLPAKILNSFMNRLYVPLNRRFNWCFEIILLTIVFNFFMNLFPCFVVAWWSHMPQGYLFPLDSWCFWGQYKNTVLFLQHLNRYCKNAAYHHVTPQGMSQCCSKVTLIT